MAKMVVYNDDGTEAGTVQLNYREFRTGSKGWRFDDRVTLNGVDTMIGGNAVIQGSKPGSKNPQQYRPADQPAPAPVGA